MIPIGFAVSGSLFMWGLMRFHLLDILPAAREPVFERMKEAVLVLDAECRLADFNRAAREFLPGLSRADIGRPAEELLKAYPELLERLSADTAEEVKLRIAAGSGDRVYQCRLSLIHNHKKRLLGRALILSDVTTQEKLLETIERMATTDGLTGILNRRHFLDLSRKEIIRAKRYMRPFSLILMDLDHFMSINDSYGHEAGDQALHAVAEMCRAALRDSDLFGRYGGEEFICFLPETPPNEAFLLAERLCELIAAAALNIDGEDIKITASFGVAGVRDPDVAEMDELLKTADQALFKAKKTGRNRAVLL